MSEDLKFLTRAKERQNVPDNEERFDTRLYVLGKKVLSEKHNYWKVNVEGSRYWTIGVASKEINRKGKLNLSPDDGFWLIELVDEKYKALEDHPNTIAVSKELRNIGIYIHMKKGKVVFYDADKRQQIYSFKKKFDNTISLYPFFSVWKTDENIHVCSDNCPHCPQKDSDTNTQTLLNREAEDSEGFMDRCICLK